MSADFSRGDVVWLRDYPFGRPLNIKGEVVGILPNDNYNVLLQNGLYEGQIKKYKFWKLLLDKDKEFYYSEEEAKNEI